MANGWADHSASFRGVAFDVLTESTAGERAQAVYQAPYSNGADVEDMGGDVRRISVRGIITHEDYQARRDALVTAFETSGPGTLIHPNWGEITVSVRSWVIEHEADSPESCTFSLECVLAHAREAVTWEASLDWLLDHDVQVLSGGVRALKQLQDQLNDAPTMLGNIQRLAESVRAGLQRARRWIRKTHDTLDDLLSPPDWLGGILTDSQALASELLNTGQLDALVYWRGLRHGAEQLVGMFTDDDPPALHLTAQLLPAAVVTSAVQTVIASERLTPQLTPLELAVMRDESRQVLQEAIHWLREQPAELLPYTGADPALAPIVMDVPAMVSALKAAGAMIQQEVQVLIERRPPLITYTIELPCNLRLLAHALYGDHERATELARLNPDLVNPARLMPGMTVRCYAQ